MQRLSPRHSRSPARNPRSSPRYPQSPARSPRSSRYLRSPTRSPRSSPRYPQSPARSRRSSRYPRSPTRSPRSSPRYPQSPARSPPRSPTFPQNPARSPHSSPRFPQSPAKSPPRSPRFPQSPARSPPRSPTFPQNPARSPPRSPRFPQSPARIPPRSPRRPRSPPQNIAFPVTELPPSNSQTIVQDDAVGLQHRRVPFQPNASLYNRLYWSAQWREDPVLRMTAQSSTERRLATTKRPRHQVRCQSDLASASDNTHAPDKPRKTWEPDQKRSRRYAEFLQTQSLRTKTRRLPGRAR